MSIEELVDQSAAAANIRLSKALLVECGGVPVPNTIDEDHNFVQPSNRLSGVDNVRQVMVLISSVWDQIGNNRTIAETNKCPGDYFAEYAASLSVDIKDDEEFLAYMADHVRQIDESGGNVKTQPCGGIVAKLSELLVQLKEGFDA